MSLTRKYAAIGGAVVLESVFIAGTIFTGLVNFSHIEALTQYADRLPLDAFISCAAATGIFTLALLIGTCIYVYNHDTEKVGDDKQVVEKLTENHQNHQQHQHHQHHQQQQQQQQPAPATTATSR